MINDFIKIFTDKEIRWIKEGDSYYLVSKELAEIRERIKLKPEYIGLFLGKDTGKGFIPSPALIEEISRLSDKKAFVDKKAEMLFLCGRDILGRSVLRADAKNSFVLVQNEKDENLGYGKIIGDLKDKDRIVIENLLDKGNYLRREMKKY